MTRTTKTAAAAPAPRDGRNGKVRAYKANPETLASADLSAIELPEEIAAELIDDAIAQPAQVPTMDTTAAAAALLNADMLAMLQEAEQEIASQAAAAAARKEKTPRVPVTPQQGAALAAAGWVAPRIDANLTAEPESRTRLNVCKGAAAYRVAALLLQSGPVHVADLAALWVGAGNQPRALNGVVQQLANRTGRSIKQEGAILTLA